MSATLLAKAKMSRDGYRSGALPFDLLYPPSMYADGWRSRLREELVRTGLSNKAASQAARMNDGWVGELLNPARNKEPTLTPFVRMCIEAGIRMNFVMTGADRDAESEQFSALFQQLDDQTKAFVIAGMRNALKEHEAAPAKPSEEAKAS